MKIAGTPPVAGEFLKEKRLRILEQRIKRGKRKQKENI